jgi:gliding-associated putative ABC transporter substrate-binding component GldG
MKSKKITHETSSIFSIVTVIIVLAIAAIISQGFIHTRFDLTEDKQFTLGAAAVKTLENLPDLVTIKAVMSSELPTQFVQIRTHVKDILEEFRARAKGKLELIFIDPGEDEEKKKQVRGLGVQEVQMQEQSQQGLEIKKGFFGLAITYGDKKEVIPVLSSIETFEYDLIVKIKKLTGSIKKVGVVEGNMGNKYTLNLPGNPPQMQTGFDQAFPSLKGELEKLYKLEHLKLASSEIADDIELLLVVAPKKMNDVEKFRLDQFLMKGKSIFFLTPGVDVNLGQGLTGQAAMNGYEGLLNHYGISIKKNVILEARNFQFVPFGNSFFPTPYPYWIVVPQGQLNAENAITSRLGQLSFPWPSSLKVDSSKIDSGNTVIVLASSSKDSWEETGRFMLYPRDLKEFLPVNQSSQPLVVLKTGIFTSFYDKNPLPADSNFQAPAEVLKKSITESRILVVGNAMFATNFYLGLMRAGSNLNFILNSVDQLALDPDLIKIRSRDISSRPIAPEKKTKKLGIVLTNMLVAPVFLLAIGIAVGFIRRKREAQS